MPNSQLTASTGLNQKLRIVQRYVLEDCGHGNLKDIAHKTSVLPSLLNQIVKVYPGSTYRLDVEEEEDNEGEFIAIRLKRLLSPLDSCMECCP